MATANEIEGYNSDPRIGFGSDVAAGMTGVVWDFSESDAAWARFAQNKLAVAKDLNDQLKRKQLAAQAEVAKLLDQENYKIWAADREAFKPLWNEFTKTVIDVAKRGKMGDVNDPEYEKVLTQAQNLRQFAQYSTQQEKHWDVGFNDFQKNKDQYDPNSETQLNSYRDVADPIKRSEMDYSLSPASGFDLGKIVKDLERDLTTGKTTRSTTHKDQYGQLVTDIEDVQQLDLSNLPARLDDLYKTDPKIRRTADEIYSTLTPEQQAQFGNNPAQTLQTPVLARLNATTTEKQQFRTDWMSQFAARAEEKGALDAWIVDTGVKLHDPNSDIWQGETAKGFKYAVAPAGTYIKAPANIFEGKDGNKVSTGAVGLFVRDKNGNLYAVPSQRVTRTATGAYTWETKDVPQAERDNDLIPVDNYDSQIISPSLDTKYKGQTYNYRQDVQNYAPTGDPNDVLKIPRKKEGVEGARNSQSSGSTQSGIPSGTRAEWKAAGWNDAQINEAVKQGKIKVN